MQRSSILLSVLVILQVNQSIAQQPGDLDDDLDVDGHVVTDLGGLNDRAYGMVVQPDGRIVVVGMSLGVTSSYDHALVRYFPDGSLDDSFGGTGKIVYAPSGPDSELLKNVVLQPDGKILAVGFHDVLGSSTSFDIVLVRFNSDGTPDQSFGDAGYVALDLDGEDDKGEALVLQPDGKILVCGSTVVGGVKAFCLVRFAANGMLDESFSFDGRVVTGVGGIDDDAKAIALQGDGKIILAGTSRTGVDASDFAMVRYHSDGTLDDGFGGDGKVSTPIGNGEAACQALLLMDDGRILLGGNAQIGDALHFALARYASDGSLDASFGIEGKVTTGVGSSNEVAPNTVSGLALDIQAKILAAGTTNGRFVLVRYTTNGGTDDNFGTLGIADQAFPLEFAVANCIAVQADQKILLAGHSGLVTSTVTFTVARYLSGIDVGLADLSSTIATVLISPNPVREVAVLEFDLAEAAALRCSLLDATGREVMHLFSGSNRSVGHHRAEVDLRGLPAGQYVLSLSNGTGTVGIGVVKE